MIRRLRVAAGGWLNSPPSVESMLWYDATGSRLTAVVAALVGKSLRPPDVRAAFDAECGDFWYFLLYTHAKLRRGQHWVARQVLHGEVMEHLFKLLRLEAGAVDYWDEFPNALGVKRTLSAERLALARNARYLHCPAPGRDRNTDGHG